MNISCKTVKYITLVQDILLSIFFQGLIFLSMLLIPCTLQTEKLIHNATVFMA